MMNSLGLLSVVMHINSESVLFLRVSSVEDWRGPLNGPRVSPNWTEPAASATWSSLVSAAPTRTGTVQTLPPINACLNSAVSWVLYSHNEIVHSKMTPCILFFFSVKQQHFTFPMVWWWIILLNSKNAPLKHHKKQSNDRCTIIPDLKFKEFVYSAWVVLCFRKEWK